jgi:biotin carboxyl carrier protein
MSMVNVTIDGHTYLVEVQIPPAASDPDTTAILGDEALKVAISSLDSPESIEWVAIDGRSYEIVVDSNLRWIRSHSGRHQLDVRGLEPNVPRPASGDGRVKAPIPGMITRILIAPGDQVEVGQPLLVLEAMKMENEIRAPRSGVVSQLHVGVGQGVRLQEVMAEIT